MKLRSAFIIAALLGLASQAHAAAWTVPSGANDSFTYANGKDLNGHFGDPVTGDGKFLFTNPTTFEAVSPGTPATTTDTASVDVTANPGKFFTTAFARVEGDYSFSETPAQLTYSGKLTVDYGTGPVGVDLVFVPASPITAGEGTFIGTATILLPVNVTSLSGSLLATVNATSTDPATTFIQVKSAELSFTTVPEPASVCMLAAGGLLLVRRRRR